MAPLVELFPEGDYRFHLSLRRGEPRDFFARRDRSGRLEAERARWLAAEPQRYAALLPEGEPLLAEFCGLLGEWDAASPASARPAEPSRERDAYERLVSLGAALEPDVLFLSPDAGAQFRLRAGALCFPTGWALEEKMGHPLEFIHGVVPGLNASLAAPIQQFLGRLKPGVAFLRDNWGIAATDELNLHPARQLSPPQLPVALDRLWLRVEHQALVALPRSGGFVFGIRLALHRLDDVARDPAASRLRHALESMPSEVAAYKRLDTIRTEVIRLL